METSNWQNIPFCVEALMKITPHRVLDIGVGYGRWGMVGREFCDVWSGHFSRSEWKVRIEGVEAHTPFIDLYHKYFYDKIHTGDFRKVVSQLKARWNVIFGDVLEHFEKQEGLSLLRWSLNQSDYVLVNVPLGEYWSQDSTFSSKFERHLSVGNAEEFHLFPLRREALFQDYIGRPFGSFILSHNDPHGLAVRLFSLSTVAGQFSECQNDLSKSDSKVEDIWLQTQVAILKVELNGIKNSRGYRILNYLRSSAFAPVIRRIVNWVLPNQDRILQTSKRIPFGKLIKWLRYSCLLARTPGDHLRSNVLFLSDQMESDHEIQAPWLSKYSKIVFLFNDQKWLEIALKIIISVWNEQVKEFTNNFEPMAGREHSPDRDYEIQ